ncbi:hypothetical protein B0H13DRAFT_2351810 [Mycena leptocephala]|nr:hypothetical protein B0H13DRAFT_2351810 [Mycena leptocephala]
MANFKLRAQPFEPPELYQSAYGIVLALSIAVAGRLVTSLLKEFLETLAAGDLNASTCIDGPSRGHQYFIG